MARDVRLALQDLGRGDREEQADGLDHAEPNNQAETADLGERRPPEEMELRETIESLGGHAVERRDDQHEDEDVVPAHRANALGERADHALALAVHRSVEVLLGHEERHREPEHHPSDTGDDDRQAEVGRGERDGHRDAEQRTELPGLRPSQVELGRLVLADLVGDPRLLGAAHERPAEPPQRRAEDEQAEGLERAGDE